MPDPVTYSPEDVVTDCNVMKAVWEQIREQLDNKAQLVIAYAALRSLEDLIEIKVDHLESLDGGPIWPQGTDRGYFLEKMSNAVASVGSLAEKVLADRYDEFDVQKVYSDFTKLEHALPNHSTQYGPFLNEDT